MTPTAIIRCAALKSGEVPLANGKVAVYEDIQAEPVEDAVCWLCGAPTGGMGVPTKAAIKPTFTDGPLARMPHSKAVCRDCAFCLSFRELRNYSILADGTGLRHPARADWRQILLDPPVPPFVACVALSGQRWLHIRAQVAFSRDNFPVQVEDTLAYVDRPMLAHLGGLVDELYEVFTKDEITKGDYQPHRINQFGLERFVTLENELTPHRGNRMFDLAVLTARRKEE